MVLRRSPALFAAAATLTAGCFTDSGLTSSGAASAAVTSVDTDSGASDSAPGTSSASSGSASESEGTSTAASTTASTTTSDATGTTRPQPTTDDPTTTGDPTTSTTDAPTTTSGTTAGEDPLEGACVAACEVYVQCTGADKNACLANCTSDPAEGPCLDARIETLKCIGGLSCMELQQPIVCPHQQSLELVLCDDCGVQQKNEGAVCAVEYQCTDHLYGIVCEGGSCGCLTDNQPAGECALEVSLCDLGPDALLLEAAGCCAWYQGD